MGSPPPTLIHTVQQVPMTGIRDHSGSISKEDHKGAGTEEKSDMKSTAHFCAQEQCSKISHLEFDLYVLGFGHQRYSTNSRRQVASCIKGTTLNS